MAKPVIKSHKHNDYTVHRVDEGHFVVQMDECIDWNLCLALTVSEAKQRLRSGCEAEQDNAYILTDAYIEALGALTAVTNDANFREEPRIITMQGAQKLGHAFFFKMDNNGTSYFVYTTDQIMDMWSLSE